MSGKRRVLTFFVFIIIVNVPTFANVIWPALIAESEITSVPVILLSLIIELFFYKWLFKINLKKSIFYTLAANTISSILGIVLRPIGGIIYEISIGLLINKIFNTGTFNPVAWAFVPIIGGLINCFIELLTIKIIWKEKLSKKNFLLVWIINIITVSIACAIMVVKRVA